MKLTVISGLSGSGKSIALHTLEDLDYYCVDNLPLGLLPSLSPLLESNLAAGRPVAVSIDARNDVSGLNAFPGILEELSQQGIECEILFLRSDADALLTRYSESRRKHPLSGDDTPLAEAIDREARLLEGIANRADLIIDTTHTHVHQLRELIRERVHGRQPRTLSVLLQSFGFKHGVPADTDFVFDVRCLPNPHWDPQLRPLTGRDQPVAEFLAGHGSVQDMFTHLEQFIKTWIPSFQADNRSYLTFSIGCTGGQHRSVYLTERLHASVSAHFPNVLLRHRELS
ncbi:MAG: RNase adapter RapZ [Gammaproteobacteria bacterium]